MKKIAWWLTLIGALNWGLVAVGGLFLGGEINLVTLIVGSGSLAYIIYALVGVSAVYIIMGHCGCKKCDNGSCASCKDGSCDVHK
ncbi:MAG: hypothetical protein QG580_92 [Patescibacteria group bacterium]|jgi:uncharacterized membrane protein YuzA (DUF378 family)|nr:hypothetical protein [Patescibacteria group bacterium]